MSGAILTDHLSGRTIDRPSLGRGKTPEGVRAEVDAAFLGYLDSLETTGRVARGGA